MSYIRLQFLYIVLTVLYKIVYTIVKHNEKVLYA